MFSRVTRRPPTRLSWPSRPWSWKLSSRGNKTRARRNVVDRAAVARPRPPRTPVPGGAAAPRAATTWKLRIRWKLCMLRACFISAGRKVSTLSGGQARGPGRGPAHCPQGHHASLMSTALCARRAKFHSRIVSTIMTARARRRQIIRCCSVTTVDGTAIPEGADETDFTRRTRPAL
jgi:hypothetical protein